MIENTKKEDIQIRKTASGWSTHSPDNIPGVKMAGASKQWIYGSWIIVQSLRKDTAVSDWIRKLLEGLVGDLSGKGQILAIVVNNQSKAILKWCWNIEHYVTWFMDS